MNTVRGRKYEEVKILNNIKYNRLSTCDVRGLSSLLVLNRSQTSEITQLSTTFGAIFMVNGSVLCSVQEVYTICLIDSL